VQRARKKRIRANPQKRQTRQKSWNRGAVKAPREGEKMTRMEAQRQLKDKLTQDFREWLDEQATNSRSAWQARAEGLFTQVGFGEALLGFSIFESLDNE
jgi:hypothetical protein